MAIKKYNIIFIIILIILIFGVFLSMTNVHTTANTPLHTTQQSIIESVDGNTYSTEITPIFNTLLVRTPVKFSTRWGITFTIKLNKGSNGTWQQVIGITPLSLSTSKSDYGIDARAFAAWICPSGNGIHLRTATCNYQTGSVNYNAEITGCADAMEIGVSYRYDITSNPISNYSKQNVVATMTTLDKKNVPPVTKQIANVILDPPLYSPDNPNVPSYNGVPEIYGYIYSTYANWQPFSGTIRDIEFGVGGMDLKNAMVNSNLTNAVNYLNNYVIQQGFNTMGGSIKEGLNNIGGIGDNSGIKSYSPPTNVVNPPPPKNYIPIKGNDGNNLCTKSIVQTSDYYFDDISEYEFNFPTKIDNNGQVTESVPICSPDELYTIQTQILNELNTFNADFSNYMTYIYNYNHNVPGDTAEQLPYVNGMTHENASKTYTKYVTVNKSGSLSGDVKNLDTYKQVIQDINTYNNLLKANRAYYPDPEIDIKNNKLNNLSRMDPVILKKNHMDIVKARNELDTKLFELNNVQNSVAGESKMKMDSSIYITLLWTTLATSIVYFMFV